MSISVSELADAVRRRNPLVHNITNYVAAPLQANALSALGASPIMADDPAEAADMTALADVLAVNIGTLNQDTVPAMHKSMRAAADKGIPVVFDPVGIGATAFRRETALALLDAYPVGIIRANAGEIAAIAGVEHQSKGIDAGGLVERALETACRVALRYGCTVAMTGAADYITDGTRAYRCGNGHPMMAALVGTGCTASSVTAAFAAVSPDNLVDAAAAALAFYGFCGEKAAAAAKGPGSLGVGLLDALYTVGADEFAEGCSLEAVPV